MRVAGLNVFHDVLGQVPCPAIVARLGDDQIDRGAVAGMISPIADYQRKRIALFDRDHRQFRRLGGWRDKGRATTVDYPLAQHFATGLRVLNDKPLDAVSARRVGMSDLGLDAHRAGHRASPTDGHIAVGPRVDGHTARRQLDETTQQHGRLVGGIGIDARRLRATPAGAIRAAFAHVHPRYEQIGNHRGSGVLVGAGSGCAGREGWGCVKGARRIRIRSPGPGRSPDRRVGRKSCRSRSAP